MEKKYFVLIITMLVSMTVNAQSSSYVSSLREFFTLWQNNVDEEEMLSYCGDVNINQYHLYDKSGELLDEYMSESFRSDLYSKVIAKVYHRYANKRDINKLISMLKSSEGKVYMKHAEGASTCFNKRFLSYVDLIIESLHKRVEEIGEIQYTIEGCPESYQILFKEYYDLCDLNLKIDLFLATLEKSSLSDVRIFANKNAQRIKADIEMIARECFYKEMTEKDLKFGIRMFSSSCNNVQKAYFEMYNKELVGDLMKNCYKDWLKIKGVVAQESRAIGTFDVRGDDDREAEFAVLESAKIVTTEKTVQERDFNRIYDIVEQMPEFPGGSAAFQNWIDDNKKYPTIAKESGVQGRVVCTFVVERDGSVNEVHVARSIDPSLDKEAVRVLKNMPKWNPGRQNGVAVRVKYTVHVTFKL